MGARQQHGKDLEIALDAIHDSFHLEDDYTAVDDGYIDVGDGISIPVSVKNKAENGELCLGDFGRVVEHGEPLLVFMGEHKKGQNLPHTLKVWCLPQGYQGLLGYNGSCVDKVEDFVARYEDYMLSTIDFNNRTYDTTWSVKRKEFLEEYDAIFEEDSEEIYIHPRPKRDHKNQRRLQCAIPYRYLEELDEMYCIQEANELENMQYTDDPGGWDAFFKQVIDHAENVLGQQVTGSWKMLSDEEWEDDNYDDKRAYEWEDNEASNDYYSESEIDRLARLDDRYPRNVFGDSGWDEEDELRAIAAEEADYYGGYDGYGGYDNYGGGYDGYGDDYGW